MRQFGYGRFPNVYTALEVERLLNASGPTEGKITLGDGSVPKRVGIVHCIGSRDHHYHPYCSRVCCMYALKLAHLVKEKTQAEVFNFYIDIRTPGKAFEEFYERVQREGVQFVRGKVGDVAMSRAGNGASPALTLRVDDTLLNKVREVEVDMLILAQALEPRDNAREVRRMFSMSCSTEGFFLERHPKLAPVNTVNDGVFLAGACQSPKDIPDTVAQAGAAAAEALALIDCGRVELEPNTAWIDESLCSGCKTCIGLCPYTAIQRDTEKGIAVIDTALCKGCGTCVAACPSGAAQQHLFTDEQIYDEIEGILCYV
jgi:heterodisulfide reductase subunit A